MTDQTEATAPAPEGADPAKMDRLERIAAAKAEAEAKKAAAAAGEPMPPTPVLDYLNGDGKGPGARSAAPKGKPAKERHEVVWTREGERLDRKRFTLGFMAYESTAGIGKVEGGQILLDPSVKRLTTEEFRKVLAELGVTDPEGASWDVYLPNGRRVGAIVDGIVPPAPERPAGLPDAEAPKADKSAKAPAKKAPAAKKGSTPRRPNGQIAPKPRAAAKKATPAA